MQKITILLFALIAFAGKAQTENSKISFANTFQFAIGMTNLAPNNSMMGDAHQNAFSIFNGRFGVFSYDRFTIGIHASYHRMRVRNNQYFGEFERTTVFTPGFYLSYYQPITEEGLFEPYISYDNSEYTTKGFGKELNSESNGLGLGLDYQHKVGNKAYVTFGLKYSINKMRTKTHPDWEKYINNYNFLSARIGFTFSKDRL